MIPVPGYHKAWALLLGIVSLPVRTRAILATSPPTSESAFDFVIVGGGTSGLVVANRLSADRSISVAVIEAGQSQINNPNVTIPNSYGLGLHTDIDWNYRSVPQIYANDQPQVYDQGKGLGGTSLINGQTYVRAADAQIDAWETRFGNPGWNWDNLFPYYLKSETFQIPDTSQEEAGCNYTAAAHGEDGPLYVGWFEEIAPRDTYLDVRAAWEDIGYEWIQDPNTGKPSGASVWPLTVNRDLDIRWDAARAYLYPEAVAQRTNLQVYENTVAQRIVWSDNKDGEAQASGVEVTDAAGNTVIVTAKCEVILSAGSIKTPVLLEASGIGNVDILNANGIPVKIDLPSVGFNLQDQVSHSSSLISPELSMPLTWRRQPLAAIISAAGPDHNFTGYPTYVTYPTAVDLFGDNVSSVEDYVREQIPSYAQAIISRAAPNATSQEIQEQLLNDQADLIFKDLIPVTEIITASSQTIVINSFWGLLPFARGSVHINGSSVNNNPIIDPQFFQQDWDALLLTNTARTARKFMAQGMTAGWIGDETTPGLATVPGDATDEQWFTYLKKSYSPNYHPCGTAAMMSRELGGVLDASLKVYGTSNVRVVDASVLPAQIVGHLTSTLYAIAERASEIILSNYLAYA